MNNNNIPVYTAPNGQRYTIVGGRAIAYTPGSTASYAPNVAGLSQRYRESATGRIYRTNAYGQRVYEDGLGGGITSGMSSQRYRETGTGRIYRLNASGMKVYENGRGGFYATGSGLYQDAIGSFTYDAAGNKVYQ